MNGAARRFAITWGAAALLTAPWCLGAVQTQTTADDAVDQAVNAVESKVIAWRRDIHQHPELSNREFRTSKLVADHLRRLGLQVQTGVAHTGVVGVLKGAHPGPVIAFRADMDALPVTEPAGLPFASKVRAQYNNTDVGVMHACGHDTHTAMLMGAAEVLAAQRDKLHGTVKFIFQPAEEGAPPGEEGGAALMVKEGVLSGPDAPREIFGIHVWPGEPGSISYRARGSMAAADSLTITVHGVQTHGAQPWHGVDPVATAAQIMLGLQLIPSRQLNATLAPTVITIGSIHGGIRGNILPEKVEMLGTIRTFDPAIREETLKRIERTAKEIAQSAGATADVKIESYAPVVYNDVDLTKRAAASLERAAGGKVGTMELVMGSEDFAHYSGQIPGLFVFLGINKDGVSLGEAAENHSPNFYVNEAALKVGVRAFVFLALDELRDPSAATGRSEGVK